MKDRKAERVEFLASEGTADLLIDLSTAGAALLTSRELRPETRISLKINDFTVDALVIYCHQRANDGYRIGTLFRNVNSDLRRGLEELIDRFSRGSSITCTILGSR